jgi:hypothetical protein
MKRAALFLSIAIFASALAAAQEAKPKSVILPIALNLFPSYGVGSFIQGDPLGGFVCLAGEGAATLFGGMFFFGSLFGAEDSRAYGWVSLGLFSGTFVFAVVRPIVFAGDYNKKHGLSSLSVAPSLASLGGAGPSPGIVLKLEY